MPRLRFCGALALLLGAGSAAAATTTINGVTYPSDGGPAAANGNGSSAAANQGGGQLPPELALRLKKIFLFPSIDDLSGALAPKLDDKIFDLFNHNTRFEVIRDPQVVKALSPDELSYSKAAENQSVHREAARVTGADTTVLLRTHNVGPNTQMNLELRDANGNMLFAEEGTIPGSASMEARWGLIERLYKNLLNRLPFEGSLTGRTANTITVDLGLGSVRQGEEIEIARIVSVQRHPLLGTVVGTDYVRTGLAKITSVDRVLSFAEVQEEVPGEKIAPGQKVLRKRAMTVRRGSEEPAETARESHVRSGTQKGERTSADLQKEEDPLDDRLKGDFDRPKARYGQVGANLYFGSLGQSQSVNDVPADYSGSGVGGDLEGELWVTKNWIFSGGYGFQNANLKGETAPVGSTSWSAVSAAGGYRLFPDGAGDSVVLTGSLGYQVMSFGLPANASLSIGGHRYSGLILRADGEIAFLEQQKISVGFAIQPFASMSEGGPSLGSPGSASVIGFHLGWNRQIADQFWLRIGMRYDVANASYDGTTTTVSNKRFAIGPGIYYLF